MSLAVEMYIVYKTNELVPLLGNPFVSQYVRTGSEYRAPMTKFSQLLLLLVIIGTRH